MQWEKRRDPNSPLQPYVDHSGFAVKPGEISENVWSTGAPGVNVKPPASERGFIRAVIEENQWLYIMSP